MGNYKIIHIACPERNRLVSGKYPCNSSGELIRLANGTLDIEKVKCNQDDGKCPAVLCALHRYNKRGPKTWFPDSLYANPPKNKKPQNPTQTNTKSNPFGSTDVLC